MHNPTPSKLATWLLLQLGAGDHLDTIVGDLRERYDRHPRRWWYWRQVLVGITVSAVEEVRSHKLISIRALMIGWLALLACVELFGLFRYTLSVVANGGVDVAGYWIVLPTAYYTWVWRYGLYVGLAANVIAAAMSGWIVGRFNARVAGPMLLAFASSVLLWLSVGWSMNQAVSRAPAAVYLLNALAVSLCIMGGGILGSGRRQSASRLVASAS